MFSIWQKNALRNLKIVTNGHGPKSIIVVSGSISDKLYWQRKFTLVARDVFRSDGQTDIHSVCEGTRKGNFLGTFNAWIDAKVQQKELPNITLMSMVFGQGKRLSPFTQAMGNRKSALLTPLMAQGVREYLSVADMSNLYTNLWLQHLEQSGFRGVVVKWGDEAIIPGLEWRNSRQDFSEVDAVRFVWQTEITEDFAREKDWIVVDAQTGLMKHQFSRQDIYALRERVAQLGEGSYKYGVNLGSLAISYDFLQVALSILQEDILDPHKWADWDPYTWIALSCKSRSEWQAEIEHEVRIGKTGIVELEARYPEFYERISQVRHALEARTGRHLSIGVLDFGEAYWVDMGLHLTLRKSLRSLVADPIESNIGRVLFQIPTERDNKGNTIVRSLIPEGAEIYNSVILDSVIIDPASVINGGLVIGGRHKLLNMPHGGSALFCAVDEMSFADENSIAYRSIAPRVELQPGGRHTTLLLSDKRIPLIANESIVDYKGKNYDRAILGNTMSFGEATKAVEAQNKDLLDDAWFKLWRDWLP